MPSASDTAYPRLKTNPSAKELGEIDAPNIFELVFATEHARKPALQVGLLLLLKTFQRLGYFVRHIDIPAAIISYIARSAGYQESISNRGLRSLLLTFRILFGLHSRIPANKGLPELVIERLRAHLE
jgi:hypothetical protein